MNTFRFPLQKVLDWRRTQLDLEELQFRRQLAALDELDRQRTELEAAGSAAERQVRAWSPLAGGELQALGGFRLHVKQKQQDLLAPHAECRLQLKKQEALMLEARRRLRLLERLKERRLSEWRVAGDKELEVLASESYLARWKPPTQRRAPPYNEEHDP